jgi:hypothetical protein
MLSIADIIRLSWNTYISKFKQYSPLLIAVFILSAIPSVLNILVISTAKLTDFWKIAVVITEGVFAYVLTFAVSIPIIIFTDKFLSNKKASFSFGEIGKIFLPALAITVLVALITLGGFLFFIVPGVIFMVWYAFAIYLVILEKKSGLKVLSESRALSRNRFWPIFGRLVVPGIFWAIISYLVMAGIFNILGLIINKVVAVAGENVSLALVSALISDLVATFFAPLYVIAATIVYREARR